MKLINLNDLEQRIKLITKPTPQQVVDLITKMYKEIK